uniref:Uncharacterized protein n=1 Tax=Panagrolaimus sp. ES5 TaxID=591445 RepID=A0AC34FRR6_9BILA
MTEGGPHIGERAQNDYQEFPSFVIYDIMKVIGKRWDQINPSQQWGFQLVPADETIGFDIDTSSKKRQTFPQELVLAMFLKTMKSCADSHFGTAIKEIYISTDFFLTESQKTIFEKAAAKLNLKIVTYTLIDTQ